MAIAYAVPYHVAMAGLLHPGQMRKPLAGSDRAQAQSNVLYVLW